MKKIKRRERPVFDSRYTRQLVLMDKNDVAVIAEAHENGSLLVVMSSEYKGSLPSAFAILRQKP